MSKQPNIKKTKTENVSIESSSLGKSITEMYQKKTQLEHIKTLPETYIGSIEKNDTPVWTWDDENKKIDFLPIKFSPGFYKLFDEILVNASDHYQRIKIRIEQEPKSKLLPVSKICVDIDKSSGWIHVLNDGEGIDVVEHDEHKMWVPTMIFGELLTSTNYDQEEEKVTGGKNGYGAKLTNIFSKEFIIETIDYHRNKKFIQKFEDGMSIRHDPIISSSGGIKPYTKISYLPNYDFFKMDGMDHELFNFLQKRVIDIGACTDKSVSVFFNQEKVNAKEFKDYIDCYIGKKTDYDRVFVQANDRWEIGVCLSPNGFRQVSFVNGINTYQGGKHVEYIANQITRKIQDHVATKGYKRKKMDLKPNYIKDHMWVFVKSLIVNPSFSSQTKEQLTTPVAKFGSKCELDDDFIEKIIKIGIVEYAIKMEEFKDSVQLTKTDGKKISRISGIPKLEDANKAGTKESNLCSLILTEGDSAKTFAIAGLSVIGRDYYGVYPLKGKPLNVRDVSDKKVSENEEINDLKKIMGLQHGLEYTSLDSLRYGSILILTDQDVDGSHIKGLIFNVFHTYWPTLIRIPGFLCSMATPIVKARNKKNVLSFFTLTEYEKWKESVQNVKQWDVKYYKGLGTSTSSEAKEYFKEFDKNKIQYIWKEHEITIEKSEDIETTTISKLSDEVLSNSQSFSSKKNDKKEENQNLSICDKALKLAFDKRYADDRKEWLRDYDSNKILEMSQKQVSYDEFIHKDLIHFSNSDNERSIPCMLDGLKPSQRKVLFGAFKRNLNKSIKVAQLSGYVSEHSAYHHGEMSLNQCIISMAQDFVGSNNIPFLVPEGSFGTRLKGGKDTASPRYIFTRKSPLLNYLFHPHDEQLLMKQMEDGMEIEPKYYVPILPMILVNGCMGIGTGYSTQIPSFQPEQIVENLISMMDGKHIELMNPYFRGFNGKIEERNGKLISVGNYSFGLPKDQTVFITELPIGYWTDDFKFLLEEIMVDSKPSLSKEKETKKKRACLTWYKNDSTESKVNFTVRFTKDAYQEFVENPEKLEQLLGLTNSSYTSLSNMHLYDSTGHIKKYDTVEEIFMEFYLVRLGYYIKRKEYLLDMLNREKIWYQAKIKFLNHFIAKELEFAHRLDEDIEKDMLDLEIPKLSSDFLIENKKEPGYDYLLSMEIRSLTQRKKEELEKKLEKANHEYDELYKTSEKELWKKDLEVFLEKYRIWIQTGREDAYAEVEENEEEMITKQKKTINKKKKGMEIFESENEEIIKKPIKKLTIKKK